MSSNLYWTFFFIFDIIVAVMVDVATWNILICVTNRVQWTEDWNWLKNGLNEWISF